MIYPQYSGVHHKTPKPRAFQKPQQIQSPSDEGHLLHDAHSFSDDDLSPM